MALKGIQAQCDVHMKISKYTNEEFSDHFEKNFKEAQKEVKSVSQAINTILEAPEDEMHEWNELRELQVLEEESN